MSKIKYYFESLKIDIFIVITSTVILHMIHHSPLVKNPIEIGKHNNKTLINAATSNFIMLPLVGDSHTINILVLLYYELITETEYMKIKNSQKKILTNSQIK